MRLRSDTGRRKREKRVFKDLSHMKSASKKKSTRAREKDWLLGYGTEQSLSIGVRLPLNRLVLERLLYLRKKPNNTSVSNRDLCRLIMNEICEIWKRAGLPMKPEKKILDQLVSLHVQWDKMKKIPVAGRTNGQNAKIINSFSELLNQLCDISPSDAEEQLRNSRNMFWKEDWEFLLGQRQFPQLGSMKGVDRNSLDLLKRVAEREAKCAATASRRKEKDTAKVYCDERDCVENFSTTEEDEVEDEFIAPRHNKQRRPESIMVQIPTKNLLMITGDVADRTQLSIRSQLAITAKIVNVGGGNVEDFTLSTSSAWRQRNEQRVKVANKIKQNWEKPDFAVVHWDSKLIKDLSGRTQERVAVLVSGSPNNPPKLLGISSIENATGTAQHDAVIELLDEWNVTKQIVALVFDTTASNTGKYKGCAAVIEKTLGHQILWLACRHHIYELHIKHVAEAITGKTISPSESLFKKFQSEWDSLDQSTDDLRLFDWNNEQLDQDLIDHAKDVLNWALDCLEKKTFPREDYLELTELTVVFLGGSLPRGIFKLKKPGANHHARFMAKAIYYIKIFMMSHRFELTLNETKEVERMAFFVGLFHSQAFLTSRLACSAPRNDIKYLRLMHRFKLVDFEAGNEAVRSCFRHLWYLTEELVIFCLFDEHLSPFWRSAVAKKLLNTPRPTTFLAGKPSFPKIYFNNSSCAFLTEFVGPKSWLLFKLCKMEHEQEWLKLPVEYWHLMNDYIHLKQFISSLEVVNDAAERGIKIISDFKDMCRDEEQQNYLFQVIEAHRETVKSFTKKNLQHL